MKVIEVWVEPIEDTQYFRLDDPERPWYWGIRIDGEDQGGGFVGSHSQGIQDAANYIRDLENGEFDGRA